MPKSLSWRQVPVVSRVHTQKARKLVGVILLCNIIVISPTFWHSFNVFFCLSGVKGVRNAELVRALQTYHPLHPDRRCCAGVPVHDNFMQILHPHRQLMSPLKNLTSKNMRGICHNTWEVHVEVNVNNARTKSNELLIWLSNCWVSCRLQSYVLQYSLC